MLLRSGRAFLVQLFNLNRELGTVCLVAKISGGKRNKEELFHMNWNIESCQTIRRFFGGLVTLLVEGLITMVETTMDNFAAESSTKSTSGSRKMCHTHLFLHGRLHLYPFKFSHYKSYIPGNRFLLSERRRKLKSTIRSCSTFSEWMKCLHLTLGYQHSEYRID
ncbi:hypothetical protein TNCV_1789241 [Trichonephila clavipes]|nr:hypothetical protein TNCV_1789241 [Trichonephila clavipes]